jgi:hypothetical protein
MSDHSFDGTTDGDTSSPEAYPGVLTGQAVFPDATAAALAAADASEVISPSSQSAVHAAAVQRRMTKLRTKGARRGVRVSESTAAGSVAAQHGQASRSVSMAATAAESSEATETAGAVQSQSVIVASRLPQWQPAKADATSSTGSLALKFLGGSSRVRASSSRNFVFDAVDASGKARAVLQVGRLSDHGIKTITAFSVDFRWPMAPAQALATLLASFAWPAGEGEA